MVDDVINIVTSSGVYFTDKISKNRFWFVNYTPDDVIMFTTSSIVFIIKTCHWYKFQVDTFSRTKVIQLSAILVCKIQRKQVAEKMTPFLSINYQELLLV